MLAIIPARGSSKGLPGKNIKLLNGKPLIYYTIEAAKRSTSISSIVVSTDDEEIASVSRKLGVNVPFLRPEQLAADNAKAIDNYIYTIDRLEKEQNAKIKDFIVLQPTSPLRDYEDIDNAIKLFITKDADSVVSYTEEQHPISWHKHLTAEMKFRNIFDDDLLNRQEYEKTYYPNGSIFVFKTKLIRSKKYYSDNSFAYIMPAYRSIDIDTLEDFNYAEYLLLNKTK